MSEPAQTQPRQNPEMHYMFGTLLPYTDTYVHITRHCKAKFGSIYVLNTYILYIQCTLNSLTREELCKYAEALRKWDATAAAPLPCWHLPHVHPLQGYQGRPTWRGTSSRWWIWPREQLAPSRSNIQVLKTFVCTPGYLALEILLTSCHRSSIYNMKVDCWLLGVIL
jgi:hypothetical protein